MLMYCVVGEILIAKVSAFPLFLLLYFFYNCTLLRRELVVQSIVNVSLKYKILLSIFDMLRIHQFPRYFLKSNINILVCDVLAH